MQTSNRKLIEEKNKHLWFHGSPVILCSMRLELDEENGKLYASAKFTNVQPEHIKEITVDIICYNLIRTPIDFIYNYTYMGFDVKRNEDFGLSIDIPIPNSDTRNIEFVLKSVTTVDDETWYNENNEKFNLDLQQENIFSSQGDHNRYFRELCAKSNIDASQLIYQPVFDQYHWMCSCGCLNWNDEKSCSKCGIYTNWLRENLSAETLERQEKLHKLIENQLKAETEKQHKFELERQKAEFQQRQIEYQKQVKKQKSNKNIKRILIVALIILAVSGAALFTVNYAVPYMSYLAAKDSLDKKLYDTAMKQFSAIENFLDSEELLKEATYGKAGELYCAGNKEQAAELYQTVFGYSDAQHLYYQIEYEMANEFYDNKDYINAAEKYKLSLTYKDSSELLDKTYQKLYDNAKDMIQHGKISSAYDAFYYLGDYKDSETMLMECTYLNAQKLYDNKKYKDSINTYNEIKNYKDVKDKLKTLSNLSDIISASSDADSPAVWTLENTKCSVCNDTGSASYSFAFGINGNYNFKSSCTNHSSSTDEISGYYKIENDKIYIDRHKNGITAWEEYMTIISVEKIENGYDGKNAALTVTNPFKKNEQLTLYGNIISSNNIEFR